MAVRNKEGTMANENSVECVERHLYSVEYKQKDSQWSVYFKGRFKSWTGSRLKRGFRIT